MSQQKQIDQLLLKVAQLEEEKNEVKKEFSEFQDALIAKVDEIESSPKVWRWFRYGQLLWDLIGVIKGAVQKARNK